MRRDSLEGSIYRSLAEIGVQTRDEVAARFPQIQRRVSGYNLDELSDPAAGLDMARFVVGSEGTLLTVTDARVRIVPRPRHKALAVLHFGTLQECVEATVPALEVAPASVELVDSMILRQARANLEYSRMMGFLEGDPEAVLLVEMTGDSETEAASKLDALERRLQRAGMGYAVRRVTDEGEQAQVWAVRKAGLGLMMNVPGNAKPLPFVEDTAVDPEKLPEYVRRFDEIVRSHGTTAGYYGHASVGCLHIRPLIDLKDREGVERMVAIASDVSDLVLEFGGAMSGEHGDGLVRSPWIEKMFGPKVYAAFRRVKRAFDPDGIMNPGKIVDPAPMTENLRFNPAYRAVEPDTGFSYAAQGGFGGAIEMCNGQGACPQGHVGYDVPVIHGHARRGALHPWPGKRPAGGHIGRAAPQLPHRQPPLRCHGPLHGVQGLQGRVPLQRRHGQAEVRVPGPVPQGQRTTHKEQALRQHRRPEQTRLVHGPRFQRSHAFPHLRRPDGTVRRHRQAPDVALLRKPDLQAVVQGQGRVEAALRRHGPGPALRGHLHQLQPAGDREGGHEGPGAPRVRGRTAGHESAAGGPCSPPA